MKKWAIVTGAGTGIGAAVTKALAGAGLNVLAVGRRKEPLESVAAAACSAVYPLQGDIAKEEVIEDIVKAIPAGDNLCYLIQNAAVGKVSRLADLQKSDLEYAIAVNVTAPLFLTQRLLPRLKASNGRILHLGTHVAFNAQVGTATYGITKMAFHRLYQQLKVELEGTGVHVGSVNPGIIDTEGLRDYIVQATDQGLKNVDFFQRAEKDGLMKHPDVAASFILYLLQDTSNEEFSRQEWKLLEKAN